MPVITTSPSIGGAVSCRLRAAKMARPQTSPNVRGPVGVPDVCGATVSSSRDRGTNPYIQRSKGPSCPMIMLHAPSPVNLDEVGLRPHVPFLGRR